MNLFELFCKIFIDDEDYQKGLDDAKKHTKSFAKDAGKTIQDFAKKAENALSNATKIASAVVGAASTGVGFLVKAAVAEFANYEQLVGGVETLFKESADVVQRYADNAYKTAGLSANDYMETVTSFSASLLQSLGGDTAEAADKANLAITDMSDNANKMGTDMSLIQNAYRGFAKANYTMLDNLALGYGGTQEEMQRLLDDANALNRAQGKNTDYTIESFADIVDAIHDVQTQLGITGTTAKEAATTIQGSVNAAKGAWHNLLIGVADDNQDFDKLVDNFVESVDTAADNILPRVEKSLDGILKLVNKAGKTILPRVIAEISAKLPDLIDTGAEIALALGEGIVDNLDGILGAAEKVITRVVPKLAKGFAAAVPKIAQSCGKIIKELDGVAEMVGGVILTFKSLISGNWIGAGIGLIVTAIGGLRKLHAAAVDDILALSDADKKLMESAKNSADALYSAKDAHAGNVSAIEMETKKTQDLWAELQTLTDETGYVDEANRDRADYILGELNNALETEYRMNDGIIGQYQQMQSEIDTLIQKRHASALLESGEKAYAEAMTSYNELYAATGLAAENLARVQKEYNAARAIAEKYSVNEWQTQYRLDQLGYTDALEEAQAAYDEAFSASTEAAKTIANYQSAENAMAEGRVDDVISIMTKETSYRWKYVDDMAKISDAEKEQLQKQLREKKLAVEAARKSYLDGDTSAELLSTMENDLMTLAGYWEDATGEAYDCGENLALGIKEGFLAKKGALIAAVAGTVQDVVKSLQQGTMTPTAPFAGYSPTADYNFDERTHSGRSGSFSSSSSSSSSGRAAESTEVTINVHADTDDLGTAIAAAVQQALDGVLAARGTTYRGGRTANAY